MPNPDSRADAAASSSGHHQLTNSTLALLSRGPGVLSYHPANGLADQLRQFSVAHALAQSLGRRLVLPPLLRHMDATVLTAERSMPLLRRQRPSLSSLIEAGDGVPLHGEVADAAERVEVLCAPARGPIQSRARPPTPE